MGGAAVGLNADRLQGFLRSLLSLPSGAGRLSGLSRGWRVLPAAMLPAGLRARGLSADECVSARNLGSTPRRTADAA